MKFRIFDFDDTLVKTDSKVIVHGKRGTKELSSAEFATYRAEPGDKLDLSQFENVLINPRAIPKYVKKLRMAVGGSGEAIILTARGDERPVAKFLKAIGITGGVKIVALNTVNPDDKRRYIERLITQRSATDIEFYDDSPKNIRAVQTLTKKYPGVRLKIVHVPSVH